MRAVIAHAPDEDIKILREFLFGAGFQCHTEDCVHWDQLAQRLARVEADLIVLSIPTAESFHRHALHDALLVTSAPKLAVGAAKDRVVRKLADQVGVEEFVDKKQLDQGLHQAIDRLRAAGALTGHSGRVISVFAPAPGSGATTVAVHLAASLAAGKPDSVALLELSHEPGDLALMLDLEPMHTAQSVCDRWRKLDQVGLQTSLCKHSTGVHVLANAVECDGNQSLSSDAVRRITVLSRIIFRTTVIALDNQIGEEALTAMRLSNAVLMVVRPDVPGIRRAQQARVKVFEGGIDPDHFQVVVNRWGQRGQLAKDQIESSLRVKPMDFIPDDSPNLNRATNEGKLLHSLAARSKIVKRFDALAKMFANGIG